MSICLRLLVTGQSQLQPQQLRIFVEAHFLQSKFRAIEEARIPGNEEIVSVPLKFHWFCDFYMVKNAKKP